MSILGTLADLAASGLFRLSGLTKASRWSARVTDRLAAMTITLSDDCDYTFVASSPLLLWRAQTLFLKEPETIAWIRSFSPEDVLFDVGANVGTYTIYAGCRGVRVFAFEPESANFSSLNRNIALNKLSGSVKGYPIAIAEGMVLDTLRLASVSPGAALHTFGSDIDFRGERFTPAFEQGCMAVSLDELVGQFGLPQPTRLKIDVDGLEQNVIRGAANVLADRRLRDVLIEINEESEGDRQMIASLGAIGFAPFALGESHAVLAADTKMRNVILRRHEG